MNASQLQSSLLNTAEESEEAKYEHPNRTSVRLAVQS